MYRSAYLAAFVVLAGCGDEPPPMELRFSNQALLEDASLLAIYFYESNRTCAEVRAQVPRPQSLLGPYQANLDDQGRQEGVVFRLDEVPVGTYLVFVDALDANGAQVGVGCSPGQQIFEKQRTPIRVEIGPP